MTVATPDYILVPRTTSEHLSPVFTIIGAISWSQLTDEQREYVEHAQQSVEVMTETVDRAIETARAQRGARPAQARQESVSVRALLGKDRLSDTITISERPELRFSVDESVP